VASGNPLRRKAGDWIMLFSARCGGEFGKEECDGGGIGLATAPTPEGPWAQHPTPVINRAQGGVPAYVASVIFARGQYHLYCENETAADMGKLTRCWYLSIKNRSAATTLCSAVSDRCGTAPRSFGATFWNPGVKTEKTAKKREKTGQKWARYGLRKRVRAALLCLTDL